MLLLSSVALAVGFGSVALGQITPTPGSSVAFQIGSVCLTADSDTDGAAVYIAQCSLDPANRSWQVVAGGSSSGTGPPGQLKIFGDKCLDVTNGVNADGTKMQVWTCATGNTNQMWNVNHDGTITWVGTNKCLDLTNGVTTDGNPIQVWTCSSGDANQEWEATAPASGSVQAGEEVAFMIEVPAVHEDGCLTASANADGAAVVFDLCQFGSNGLPITNQTWTVVAGSPLTGKGPAGQLQVFGTKCLDVTNGNTADGTKLQVWTCATGNTNQMWQLNGDQTIGWVNQNKCADLTNGNMASGTPIQSWTCTKFDANQQWSIDTLS